MHSALMIDLPGFLCVAVDPDAQVIGVVDKEL